MAYSFNVATDKRINLIKEIKMKFTNDANVNMTSLKGSVTTNFSKLVETFGEPDRGPDDMADKTTCEWHLCFEDGTVATIYDWKTDYTPMQEYEWHIGGRSSEAVDRVLEVLYQTV
jgi:hypothetical protein